MFVKSWDKLPKEMQLAEVRPYWTILKEKKFSLFWKRVFDIILSSAMLAVLSPLFFVLAIAIKADSKGPVFYRQVRITQYGNKFRIHKFRSMCNDDDRNGDLVTVKDDVRITKVGKVIRKYRLDEIAQLIDILQGTMSFVGTRPEVPKYVKSYSPEMMATLLLPAGVTSKASVKYKDENELFNTANNIDEIYVNVILPEKMRYNLDAIKNYSFFGEIEIMIKTVMAMLGQN